MCDDRETIGAARISNYPQPYPQVCMWGVDATGKYVHRLRDSRSTLTPTMGDVDETITDALQRRVVEMEDGSGCVVTSWVAVVEYITDGGTQELALIHDEQSPDWRIDGLLSGGHALVGWDEVEWDSDD